MDVTAVVSSIATVGTNLGLVGVAIVAIAAAIFGITKVIGLIRRG